MRVDRALLLPGSSLDLPGTPQNHAGLLPSQGVAHLEHVPEWTRLAGTAPRLAEFMPRLL